MLELLRRRVGPREVVIAATDRVDGDFHPIEVPFADLRARQSALTVAPWTMTDQVHGVSALTVDDTRAWAKVAGTADVVVVPDPRRPVAVWAADCAPLLLVDDAGSLIVGVHAGWRGLARGVVDVGVDAVEAAGGEVAIAVLGPSIHVCCYEFGVDDLHAVAVGVGADATDISGVAANGTMALDTVAAVRIALARRNIRLDVIGACTGCDGRWFSHRTRAEPERHATVAWFEDDR